MEHVAGKTFRDTTVCLDFSSYEKCSFINCVIKVEFGVFRLVNSDMQNCKLSLAGPALTIAKMIKGFFKDKPIIFEK